MAGGVASIRRRLLLTGELVAFPHTVFALPFAFMGMLLGAGGLPSVRQILWITAAMVGARTAAMTFNRIADRKLDAANPRTSGRPLPSGRLSVAWAMSVLVLSAALFVLAAWALGPVCLALSPLALAVVLGYSYTKRFTWVSHMALGLALAIAPVGAWLAVSGPASIIPALLAAAVLFWTAGFDIIYACQDVGFDRRQGLASLPARFGIPAALKVSSAVHLLMVAALVAVGVAAGLGAVYFSGLGLAAALLVYEHHLVRPDDLSRIDVAFFTMNGWISVALCLATLADVGL